VLREFCPRTTNEMIRFRVVNLIGLLAVIPLARWRVFNKQDANHQTSLEIGRAVVSHLSVSLAIAMPAAGPNDSVAADILPTLLSVRTLAPAKGALQSRYTAARRALPDSHLSDSSRHRIFQYECVVASSRTIA
jgi:hypothetical protein